MDDNGMLIPVGMLIIFICWFIGGMFTKSKSFKERISDVSDLFGMDDEDSNHGIE